MSKYLVGLDGHEPGPHSETHEDNGSDEINVDGLSGELADAQKITVRKNSGANVGTRRRINLIEGALVNLTVADDAGDQEVDVTIGATADLDDLSDVALGTPTADDYLVFDGADWINLDTVEEGEFIESATTVPAGPGTYTTTISLGHSGFNMGHIVLYLPNTVTYSSHRRMTSSIWFTTDINNAIARSGGRKVYTIVGYYGIAYYFTDYWIKGYYYADDSKLSDAHYRTGGGSAGAIRIKSCQIVGDEIQLVWENTHTTLASQITCKGRYRVWV